MSFSLPDFDSEFSKYLQRWYEKNFGRFRTYDEMEAYAPEVYQTFLDSPQPFLGGQKPGEFFDRYSDPAELVQWLAAYVDADVSVPDMLLNRIAELGEPAAEPIAAMLRDPGRSNELRMHLISLLREIDSPVAYPLFAQWIVHWDGQDELTENAVETLESASPLPPDIAQALESGYDAATPQGKMAILSILSRAPVSAGIARSAIRLFEEQAPLRIYLASVLARIGDPAALPALKRAALSRDTGYLLYIELRSAIEALGGDAPKRKFLEGDPEYDSMRHLDDLQGEKV